jgi:hypothetical protein
MTHQADLRPSPIAQGLVRVASGLAKQLYDLTQIPQQAWDEGMRGEFTPGDYDADMRTLGRAWALASLVPIGGVAGRLQGLWSEVPEGVAATAAGAPAAPILDHAALLRMNAELGRAGEEAVGIPAGAPKPSINIAGTTRYPDRLTMRTIEEVKNVNYLAFRQQLRDYLMYAQKNNLTFVLHVRPETTYSGPLQNLIDAGHINLKYIPRPSR